MPHEQSYPNYDKLHLVGFTSRSLSDTERNYEIHNKELLSAIWGLKEWRHILEETWNMIEILNNHRNLKDFWMSHNLNCQQACWSLFLAWFNFSLIHRPGQHSAKPDALSHWVVHLRKKTIMIRWCYWPMNLQIFQAEWIPGCKWRWPFLCHTGGWRGKHPWMCPWLHQLRWFSHPSPEGTQHQTRAMQWQMAGNGWSSTLQRKYLHPPGQSTQVQHCESSPWLSSGWTPWKMEDNRTHLL